MTKYISRSSDDTLGLLHPKLVSIMKSFGYKSLTPIQIDAIPKVLNCSNVLIVAPTGSGKTEAALFPIFSEILKHNFKPISAIYITPLRALNRDIFYRMKRLCESLGISLEIRHGDTPQSRRKLLESRPPHILITTPESFSLILVSSKLRKFLENVKWVIIDEFHELLGSKRGAELLVNLERLKALCGPFKRIALSASIGNVGLAKEALAPHSYVCESIIPKVREADIKVVVPSKGLNRIEFLAKLVKGHKKVLIFTNTRDEAEWLSSKLAMVGVNVRTHHGSLSRDIRKEVEEQLKFGIVNCVVSTSSLELGIDIGDVDLVIQVSSPKQAFRLMQRVGRSLHKFTEKARGIIVCSDSLDEILESIVLARRSLKGDLERIQVHRKPLDVLAHVIVGLTLERGRIHILDVYELVRRSYPYENLAFNELENTVRLLQELGYVKYHNGYIEQTGKGRLYYLRTTMIVDKSSYEVVDIISNKKLGNLDEDFVACYLREGEVLVLSGSLWSVINVDNDRRIIYVEPTTESEGLLPTWLGESIPVAHSVAKEVCWLRRIISLNYIPHEYLDLANDEALRIVTSILNEHKKKGYPIPTHEFIIIEVVRGKNPLVIMHTCLGSNGNRGLGLIISNLILKYYGVHVGVKTDPYRVILLFTTGLTEDTIANIIKGIFDIMIREDPIDLIRDALRGSRLFSYVCFKILNRLGVIQPGLNGSIVNALISKFSSYSVIEEEIINEVLHEYIDLDAIKDFIRKYLKNCLYKIIFVEEPSPIACEGLRLSPYYEKVKIKVVPKNLIVELVKRRLLSKDIGLICMVCGYAWKSKVSDLSERISCPKCGLALITFTTNLNDLGRLRDIVVKGIKAGKNYRFVLREDEKRIFEKLMDVAKLTLVYGKKAIIALSAHGIGPQTAKKILHIDNEEEFYMKIYELEKQYLRTRRYWD